MVKWEVLRMIDYVVDKTKNITYRMIDRIIGG
jgi:hypothetical protein